MKNHIFKTLFNGNANESFKLHIYFENGIFYLTAVEDLNAWKATISTDALEELAGKHECSLEEYCDKLSKHFYETPTDVVFSTDDKHFYIHQIIVNKGNQIRAKFFQCEIEKADYKETVESLLDSYYSNAQELEAKFERVQKENDLLQKSNTECRNKLEEFVYTRRLQEDDLYKNFIIILNEKKRRIQHLSELLEAFKNGRTMTDPIDVIKKHKRKKQKKTVSIHKSVKKEQVSESEGEEENMSTDNDSDALPDVKQEQCEGAAVGHCNNSTGGSDLLGPSTSKTGGISDSDFDMLRDDPPMADIRIPKRLKRNDGSCSQINSSSSRTIQKPSTEQMPSEKSDKIPKKEEARPTIDFSTQDLLDNL